MSRIGPAVAAAAMLGVALAGCSAMPDWAPDWMSSKSTSDQLQALNFESDPPGAGVRTIQGQTCITPCALTVASEEQPVTITRDGYMPQTVQVTVGPQPEHSFWQHPAPTLVPNPVRVVMQAVPTQKPARKLRRRTPVRSSTAAVTPRSAAKTMAGPGSASGPFPDPPQPHSAASSSGSPFPPPPSTTQEPAGPVFPPPPSNQ